MSAFISSPDEDFADEVAFDRAYVAKFGPHGFLQLAWPVIEPGTPFADNWHLYEVCNHLGLVSVGVIQNLANNIPPGTGKSIMTSVAWPAWTWGPAGLRSKKFLFTSYAPTIVNRDAEKCFELMSSEWYRARWPEAILLDYSVSNYRTKGGGWRLSRAIRGQITGVHPDIKSVDDPIKASDTMGTSSVTRHQIDYVNKVFWDGTMASRGNPKTVAEVLTMQRLHEDDLTGYATGKKPFVHLRFPMRYEADNPCRTAWGGDHRQNEGELLWPERFGEKEVAQLERDLNVHAPAQLQQRPTKAGGQIFRKDWFKYWTDKSEWADADLFALSWDMTFKDAMGSDFVCGQVWAKKGAHFYLVHQVYDRMNFPATLRAFRLMCVAWPQATAKLIEDKANGPAVIAVVQNEISGVIPVEPLGSKVTRANGCSPLHQAGNVHYPHPDMAGFDWVHKHVTNMIGFPLARHDDDVDAETQALHHLLGNRNAFWDAIPSD